MKMRTLVSALAVTLTCGVLAAPASAEFGVSSFDGEVAAGPSGDAYTQAGGHPFLAAASVGFNTVPDPLYPRPDGDAKTVEVTLPAGFVGNPGAVTACSRVDFARNAPNEIPDCAASSQVGMAYVDMGGYPWPAQLFNLKATAGAPATFGFAVLGIRVVGDAFIAADDGYRVGLRFDNIAQGIPVPWTKVEFWGNPADSLHDSQRVGPVSANAPPFVTLPTACTAPGEGLVTDLIATSWNQPDVVVTDSFESHLPPGYPLPESEWGPPQGPTGCDEVPFDVEARIRPTSQRAAAPTGLEVELAMPQDGLSDPGGLATAHLKRAEVALPKGMTVNSATAAGMVGCSLQQIKLGSNDPAACPDASRLGSVEVETPLLEEPLKGGVYLARQGDNPFGTLLALYLVASDSARGIEVKLPGRITPDPNTGQLRAVFDDNPQLPFEVMTLKFRGGDRAALVNPPACGSYVVAASFSSWARPGESVASNTSFAIDEGCGGGGFAPGFEAGTTNPRAGDFSPFALRVTRQDGEQNLAALGLTLPEGLLAKLTGVAVCGDVAVASGNCSAVSQVGTTTVGTGAGPDPLYVPEAGKAPTAVYLAGPYKGAPYSLVVKVPAQAGPFDLGTVTVRNALHVDPVTAQVTAKSDPLPQILDGIPVSYRDVRVDVDRSEFMVNPTSCDPGGINGSIASSGGRTVDVRDGFGVANCERLSFKPKLSMRFHGAPTRRGGFPALRAVMTAPKGQANIGKATVLMPKTELLEQGHIRTICTREQWASDSCPKGSIYGKARAFTPLLDKPLEGNVYLRANGGARQLPDLVADLKGQIDIELVGYIDAVNARLRARFLNVPDAPVSKFVLNMQGGKKGLLVHNTNVCKTQPRASVKFDGQNGKLHDFNPKVAVGGCGKKK